MLILAFEPNSAYTVFGNWVLCDQKSMRKISIVAYIGPISILTEKLGNFWKLSPSLLKGRTTAAKMTVIKISITANQVAGVLRHGGSEVLKSPGQKKRRST